MLNKLVGINYQITKKHSVDILYRLEKRIRQSIYDMNNLHIPDKDKLFNQLNNISTWDLVKLVYIKLLFAFTYKCQYYCMSDEAKLAQKAYLKDARKYKSVMSAKKLLAMPLVEVSELIKNLRSQLFHRNSLFFENGAPYVIYQNVRYNLWDQISMKGDKDAFGALKTLADVVIPVCKYEGDRLDGKIITPDDTVQIPEVKDDKYHSPFIDKAGLNSVNGTGYNQFI